MLGPSWVAAQLAASQVRLSSVSEWVIKNCWSEWPSLRPNHARHKESDQRTNSLPKYNMNHDKMMQARAMYSQCVQDAPQHASYIHQTPQKASYAQQKPVQTTLKLSLYWPWRPIGLWEFEAPTFSDIRNTDGGKVISPTRRLLFTPRKIPRTHFC
jgi:hypothetical protein